MPPCDWQFSTVSTGVGAKQLLPGELHMKCSKISSPTSENSLFGGTGDHTGAGGGDNIMTQRASSCHPSLGTRQSN